MVRNRPKSQVLLDWFSVTYRSVFVGILALAVVLAGAVGAWIYFQRILPRTDAERAIESAQVRYEEARSYDEDDGVVEMIASAGAALSDARASFAGSRYDSAREAAIRSESLSVRVLDLIRGDGADDGRSVRFFRIEGDVRVKRAREFAWEAADRKMMLGIGDQVKTSSSASAQIIYFDGTVTTIQPGSLLEIRDLYENPVTKVRKVSEKLNWGEVLASTQTRNVDGSFHEVTTEEVAARSAEEGEFRVAYDRDGKTASFDVFNGKVEVAGRRTKEVVGAGERIRTTAGGKLLQKEVLLDPPRLMTPPDQRIFVYESPADSTTRLAWEKVPGAARYRLLISRRFLFTDRLYDRERTDTSVVIDGISEGEYYWKVSARDATGKEGPFSETRQFRVTTQSIRDPGDTTPPHLEIAEVIQTGPVLIMNGRTEPGAQVWVGNEKVDVSDDGTFYTVVRLRKEGVNELTIVAQDAAGNQETRKTHAYVESY